MASRIIQIEVRGDSGNYEATVNRIIDKNNQLNRSAVEGAEKTKTAFGNLQKILINIPSFFSGIASGIAGAFGVGAIVSFTKQIVDAAGKIDDLAKRTGFSRQTLSGLKSTIEENGGSLEAFAKAINKAQQSLADIEGDGKKAGQALKAMGLNVDELVKASPEQFFEKFAGALSQVEGQNNRVAIATRVMGKAGAEQIPIILELADKFKTLREQGVSDDAIKQLDKFGDAITRLKNSMLGLAMEGIAAVIRGFDRLFSVTDLQKARDDIKRYSDEIENIDKMLQKREALRGGKFTSFFTVPKEQDAAAIQQRADAQRNLFDATDRLLELQKKEQDKPTGPNTPLNLDEGAAKRQLEALEQAKTKLLQLKLAAAEAQRAEGDLTVDVRSLAVALIEQEKNAAISAATQSKSLTPALRGVIEAEADLKIKQFDASEALKDRAKYIDQANQGLKVEVELAAERAEGSVLTVKSYENENNQRLQAIELEKQVGDAQVEQLTILGRTSAAERLRLENQLKYLQKLKEAEGIDAKTTALRTQQIENVQTQLQQLNTVTVNVGQTIANSVGDAFEGVILGTRKLADVGKGLMSALIRDIGSFFTQALVKKLDFEKIVLTNSKSFGAQLAGSGGFFGGLANWIFGGGGSFGFGTRPAGVEGPSFANSGFFSQPQGGGGGGGGGSGALGMVGSAFSTLSTAWTAISSFLPATLTATITSMAASIGATVSTAITSTLTTITGWLATIPVVGWIAAAVVAVISGIYRIIANQQERPNIKLIPTFEGVAFDPTSQQFVPGDINVAIGRKVGIKNSQAGQLADNLQKRLVVLSNQWTDILNIFPDFIAEDIQPALDETNRRLNYNFRNLKFSPGGTRSITEELESISGPAGLFRFFQAFAPSIEQGFRSSLQRGGIQIGSAAGFANLDPNRGTRWGASQEDWDKFIGAIKDVAALTGQLGKTGAGKFLTGSDISSITSLFDQLFSITDPATFVKAAAEIQDKLKPAMDFIQQSMQEATDIFGRGLIAAMEAATESDAQAAFLRTIGEGVKDKIFSGIVESFTASAQFADLLAPIQQIIREFTQQALTTGVAPDIQAFRRAIYPNIVDISTRAQTLAPLVGELQTLGFDIKNWLNLNPAPVAPAPAPAVEPVPAPRVAIEINIENYTREDDPAVLARRIGELLSGKLAPA